MDELKKHYKEDKDKYKKLEEMDRVYHHENEFLEWDFVERVIGKCDVKVDYVKLS